MDKDKYTNQVKLEFVLLYIWNSYFYLSSFDGEYPGSPLKIEAA